ncbi:MAG: zinc D-Ala-D-Ala carboxypeptidase [Paracoccaceae bacterium]|jgi:zinc D-Ala-D-Ala carboxypeptidase
MKRLVLILPLLAILAGMGVVSCGSSPSEASIRRATSEVARWLKNSTKISWLPRQVSGRYDGASALDNIRQATDGSAVKRSSYGAAPGGYVRLDPRMLRAMRDLAKRGYTFRVTSMAGASHSRTSRHYAGLAFDVDMINGRKVGYRNPYWRKFQRCCRELGATETLGPGDRGHSNHIHAAWPR